MNIQQPSQIISKVTWGRLRNAHHLMRSAQVSEGMHHYKHLINHDLARFFYNHLWEVVGDIETPTLSWACVLLGEYYIKERVWGDWLQMVELVLPYFDTLADSCKSSLTFFQGWARFNLPSQSLDIMIDNQLYALKTWKLSEVEIAQHHILLGILYRRKRDYATSLDYLHIGENLLLKNKHEPLYLLIARDYLAATYEEFHMYDPSFLDKAQGIYAQNYQFVSELGEGAETERQDYDLGWHFMNINNPSQALTYFEQGIQNMRKHNLLFAEKMNQYGKACALMELGRYSEAIALAQDSLKLFWGNGNKYLPTISSDLHISPLYTGICLYIISYCYKELNELEIAYEKACEAENWLTMIAHPLQLSHVKRCLADIFRKWGDVTQANAYDFEADRLFTLGKV